MDTLQLVIGLIIVGIVGIVIVLGIILEATWRLSRTASRSEGYSHGPYTSTGDTVTNST